LRAISYRIGYQGEPNINSVEVHPTLSNNRPPVDGALVGASLIGLNLFFFKNLMVQIVKLDGATFYFERAHLKLQ
jgi:hypothetical protein